MWILLPKWLNTEKLELTSWCEEQRVQELNEICDARINDKIFGKVMGQLRDVISLALHIEAVPSDPLSRH